MACQPLRNKRNRRQLILATSSKKRVSVSLSATSFIIGNLASNPFVMVRVLDELVMAFRSVPKMQRGFMSGSLVDHPNVALWVPAKAKSSRAPAQMPGVRCRST